MDGSYVGKPCPKCAHVRAASEAGFDWQCPKCGIAYAKFQQALASGERQPALGPAAAEATAPGLKAQGSGMSIFAHLSILLGLVIPFVNIIVPVVIMNVKRDTDELAVACAKEAINFQISILLWFLAVAGLAILGFVIGPAVYVAMLLGVIVFFCSIILPIIAAVKASNGESYTYPRTWHIFE